MNEPTPLDKAEAAAREAAADSDVLRIVAAVLATQQAVHQQAPPAPCQHDHKRGRSAGEWLAVGSAVCVGSVGLALASIALAIAACCATGCFLILRHLWNDLRKDR